MKRVLLKISGELFKSCNEKACLNSDIANGLIKQIKTLAPEYHFSIVVGGGNFFRGCNEGKQLGLQPTTADNVGMLATVMNGLMLQDLFTSAGIECMVLSAFSIPGIVTRLEQKQIDLALKNKTLLIFVGGTGSPFFTTDTTAILRALQVSVGEVWKATKVDYVYDSDPMHNPHAKALLKITYADILQQQLKIMDMTAITLAQQYHVKLRIFNIFADNALLQVAQNPDFGSTIQ